LQEQKPVIDAWRSVKQRSSPPSLACLRPLPLPTGVIKARPQSPFGAFPLCYSLRKRVESRLSS
jgi:hypothetical protein